MQKGNFSVLAKRLVLILEYKPDEKKVPSEALKVLSSVGSKEIIRSRSLHCNGLPSRDLASSSTCNTEEGESLPTITVPKEDEAG